MTASAQIAPIATATVAVQPRPDEPAAQEVEERLRRHFAQYEGASSFAFFEVDFAHRVERYLGLKDVAAAELARIAKEFYANKTQVSMVPKPGSVVVRHGGGRATATFVMTVRWHEEPPPAAAACGYLDDSMTWRPRSLIARHVEITARIGFDADGHIVTYEEGEVALPHLRVASRGDDLQAFSSLPTSPARLIEGDPTFVHVPNGTIVEDLGELFTCGLDQTEVDTVRKVRLNGRSMWLLAEWVYDTGHNFVGDTLLVPAR